MNRSTRLYRDEDFVLLILRIENSPPATRPGDSSLVAFCEQSSWKDSFRVGDDLNRSWLLMLFDKSAQAPPAVHM
jgi:hypothetical protein